ncbi:hypothetical protein [Limnoglobus roseus]|uniref:Uncharacterized protein n=1 Tax=Limnoglobus roseus TaxID=2598579 RepID=A0A5C1ACV9_9BACT|nr:hypothetical protein [Limnoglobus roseus]QEL14888.1 hypothetical protein PX52LOC_01789 [Limnoglobus roseus]
MVPLVLVSFALGQPPAPSIKLPSEVTGQPGRILQLKAEATGPHVRWFLASDDADLVPFPDGKVALFSSPKAGKYTVLAWTAAGDVPSDAAKCVVTIAGPPAPPPAPSPFLRDLQKLYADDATTDKAGPLAQLAALYHEAVTFVVKADVATTSDLAARIRAAGSTLLAADALVGVRKRIAEEVAKELSTDGDKPLDAATRAKAAKLFEQIATHLEELK